MTPSSVGRALAVVAITLWLAGTGRTQPPATACSAAPVLLECDQVQDCSALQVQHRCQAGDRACAAFASSQNSLLAEQQKRCEAQNATLQQTCEAARDALAAAQARCAIDKSVVPKTGSRWDHNGSKMRFTVEGQKVRFTYEEPRKAIADVGVKAGTLLFEGTRSGDKYSGTAYVFANGCEPKGYQVSGSDSDDDRRIIMYGKSPRRGSGCVENAPPRNDVLVFTFLGN